MKKKILFLMAMLCLVCGRVGAQNWTWTGETPAAGNFYLYNSTHNVFLKATSAVTDNVSEATVFTLSAATDCSIAYDDNGTTKYVYESEGNQAWGTTNTNKWKIASNNGGYYIYHQDPGYKYSRDRYINYNGSSIDYSRNNFTNNNRTWKFITPAQKSTYDSYISAWNAAKAHDTHLMSDEIKEELTTALNAVTNSSNATDNIKALNDAAKKCDDFISSVSLTKGANVTNKIVNPGFESTQWDEGWTTEGFGQHANEGKFSGNNIAEMWSNGNDNVFTSGKIYQTITNIPAGIYAVKAKAVGGVDGTTSVYVTNGENTTRSIVPWREGDAAEYTTVHFVVTEDNTSVTIGFERDNQRWWTAVDDFSLTYMGAVPSDFVQEATISSKYVYTEQNGEHVAYGRGANWGTQAIPTNADGILLDVNVSNYIASIKYTDTNLYLFDAGAYNIYTDKGTVGGSTEFYMQGTEADGCKFILVADPNYAIGIGTDILGENEVPVLKLVETANAPVWKFADDKANLTVKANSYGTFVAPYAVTLPEDISAYSVTKVSDAAAALTANASSELAAATPAILKNETGEIISQTYYGAAAEGTVTVGALTGFYAAGANVPTGAYVLQNQGEGQKFYVVSDNAITGAKNRCYLNSGNYGAKVLSIAFDEETAIDELTKGVTSIEYFATNGAKLAAPQKGINLVKMSNGSVLKIFVK